MNWYDRYIDGLVQERRKSIANALELRLSCTNPIDIYSLYIVFEVTSSRESEAVLTILVEI